MSVRSSPNSVGEASGSSSSSTAPTLELQLHASRRSRKAPNGKKLKYIWRKRNDQDSRLYNLKLDINDIKQEIEALRTVRSLLHTRQLARYDDHDGTCMKVIAKYFQIFKHGFTASRVDAVGFLANIMIEDVLVNQFSGLSMVVEQWKMHSAVFTDLDFGMLDAHIVPLSDQIATVKCTGRFCAIVTHDTLALMFPHILLHPPIVKKLVGKRLVGYGQYDFEFDRESNKIIRVGVVMDLFSVFATFLPNPRELAILFNQALVVDEFYIGDPGGDDDDLSKSRSPAPVEILREDAADDEVEAASAQPHPLAKMRLDHVLSAESA